MIEKFYCIAHRVYTIMKNSPLLGSGVKIQISSLNKGKNWVGSNWERRLYYNFLLVSIKRKRINTNCIFRVYIIWMKTLI